MLNSLGEVFTFKGVRFFSGLVDTKKSIVNVAPGFIVTDKDGNSYTGGQTVQIGNPKLQTGQPVRTFDDFSRWVSENSESGYNIQQNTNADAQMPESFSREDTFDSYKPSFEASVNEVFEASSVLTPEEREKGISIDSDTVKNRLIFYREAMHADIDGSETLTDEEKQNLKTTVDVNLAEKFKAMYGADLIFRGSGESGTYVRGRFSKIKLNSARANEAAIASEGKIKVLKREREKVCAEGKSSSKECVSVDYKIKQETEVVEFNRLIQTITGDFRGEDAEIGSVVFDYILQNPTKKSIKTVKDELLAIFIDKILTEKEKQAHDEYLLGANPFSTNNFLESYLKGIQESPSRNALRAKYGKEENERSRINNAIKGHLLEIDSAVEDSLIKGNEEDGIEIISPTVAKQLRKRTSQGTLLHGILSIEDDDERNFLARSYREHLEKNNKNTSGVKSFIASDIIEILDTKVFHIPQETVKFTSKSIDGIDGVITKINKIKNFIDLHSLVFDEFSPNSSVAQRRYSVMHFLKDVEVTSDNIEISSSSLFSLGYTIDGTLHDDFSNEILDSMDSETRKKYDLIDSEKDKVLFLLKYFKDNMENIEASAESASAARVRNAQGKDLIKIDRSGPNDSVEALTGESSVFRKIPGLGERIYKIGEKILEIKSIQNDAQRKAAFKNFAEQEIPKLLDEFGFDESHPSREEAKQWMLSSVDKHFKRASKEPKASNKTGESITAKVGSFTEFLSSLATVSSLMKPGDELKFVKGVDYGGYKFEELVIVGAASVNSSGYRVEGKAKYRLITNDATAGYSDAVLVCYNEKTGKIKKVHSLEYKTYKLTAEIAQVNETEPYRATLNYIKDNSVNHIEEGDLEGELIPVGDLVQLSISAMGKEVAVQTKIRGRAIGRAASGNYFINKAKNTRRVVN